MARRPRGGAQRDRRSRSSSQEARGSREPTMAAMIRCRPQTALPERPTRWVDVASNSLSRMRLAIDCSLSAFRDLQGSDRLGTVVDHLDTSQALVSEHAPILYALTSYAVAIRRCATPRRKPSENLPASRLDRIVSPHRPAAHAATTAGSQRRAASAPEQRTLPWANSRPRDPARAI